MHLYFDEFLSHCERLRSKDIPFVIITIVAAKNSIPQDQGSKIIVSLNGIEFGTIGGGALEKRCIKLAEEKLATKHFEKAEIISLNLNRDLAMTCGGEVDVLFEKIDTSLVWKIVVFGAGHVAQALIRTLIKLECRVTCIDTREGWLDKLPKSFKLETILVEKYTDTISKIASDSFIIIMTSGHIFDLSILQTIARMGDFPYVGVIGSKSKRIGLDRELKKVDVVYDYYCPIGEPIGSNEPYEIAISIVAQLLKKRGNRLVNNL